MKDGKKLQVFGDPCPENIPIADNKEILCGWLCKFVSEACKTNGQEYIPHSSYILEFGWTPEAYSVHAKKSHLMK